MNGCKILSFFGTSEMIFLFLRLLIFEYTKIKLIFKKFFKSNIKIPQTIALQEVEDQ